MGIVDESKIIQSIPAEYQNNLKLYNSQSAAQSDLSSDQISGFYLIPSDYVKTGDVILYTKDFSPLSDNNLNQPVENMLTTSLLAGQPNLIKRIENPSEFKNDRIVT